MFKLLLLNCTQSRIVLILLFQTLNNTLFVSCFEICINFWALLSLNCCGIIALELESSCTLLTETLNNKLFADCLSFEFISKSHQSRAT